MANAAFNGRVITTATTTQQRRNNKKIEGRVERQVKNYLSNMTSINTNAATTLRGVHIYTHTYKLTHKLIARQISYIKLAMKNKARKTKKMEICVLESGDKCKLKLKCCESFSVSAKTTRGRTMSCKGTLDEHKNNTNANNNLRRYETLGVRLIEFFLKRNSPGQRNNVHLMQE